MWERGEKKLSLLVIALFVIIISVGFVYAQNETDIISEIEEEYPDAVIEGDGGIGPDNFFYFIDRFFDRFGDELKIREERIAEIRAMIEEGKIDDAREALENYREIADELGSEIDPEKRDEARRSAVAIRNALMELESLIPEEERDEFIDDVLEREEGIVTAVEIANKIKELCEDLSEIDPLEYSRVCRTSDDSPDWQRRLDKELTEEQRQEAEEFFGIMSQCFETTGGTCRCEDISVPTFADKCSLIAPLAYACDVEGNEVACDEMDAIEEEEPIEELLPDYLRDVLRAVENRFEDERFEHYGGPRECEGITDRAQCEELIFRNNAPPECIEVLFEQRDVDFNRDYGIGEAQMDCEEIMFQLFAPPECIEQGITDFRECGILTFQLNAPQACIDAGLTGENRGDDRRCQEIMDSLREGEDFHGGFGANCATIENSEERLACYDSAAQGVHTEFEEHFDGRESEEEFRQEPHGRFQTRYSEEFVDECAFSGGFVDCDGDYCDCVPIEDTETTPGESSTGSTDRATDSEERITPDETQTDVTTTDSTQSSDSIGEGDAGITVTDSETSDETGSDEGIS